jgi:hypothetical protein
MDNLYYPQITNFSPSVRAGVTADLRPDITVDWSTDLSTAQFSTASTRAQLFQLIQKDLGTIIETDYVSYTAANRRLVLRPSVDLERGKTFKAIFSDGVLSSDGRQSKNKYQWEFVTAATSVSAVLLVDPPDITIQSVFPTLYWGASSATGSVSYDVQLDTRWDFGSVAYSATTASTSITPAGSFSSEATYYWRVRAYTSTATGAWSDARSFYFGTVQVAHPTSSQTWLDSDPFGVAAIGFTDGLSNQSSHPSNLSITFTTTPASTYANYITVTAYCQLPRNDSSASYNASAVSGSWSLSSRTITFTPADAIATNTRYEIKLAANLENTYGELLEEEYRYYWTGRYTPYYVNDRLIRSRFLSAETNLPDDLINYWIYQASLEANSRFYGFVQLPIYYTFAGDMLTESLVRDSVTLKSFGALKWTEAAATYMMLKAILNDELRNVGRSRKIGDYSESLSKDFLDAMKLAMEQAKEDLDRWDDYLVPSGMPRSVSRSFDWSPATQDFDRSINRVESHRDDFWSGGF